ncbi:hypothetical protein VTI28DRAFT_8443 [Corynascus sepedonium]
MCRTYTVDFIRPPCTSECTQHLTPRVRPCKHVGTQRCRLEPNQRIQVPYWCARHLQTNVRPSLARFTHAVLNHTTTTAAGALLPATGAAVVFNKFDSLDRDVQRHLRQFAYCAFVTRQEEYYEAARELVHLQLPPEGGRRRKRGRRKKESPPAMPLPIPRTHDQILGDLRDELRGALDRYRDGDRYVRGCGVSLEAQPEEERRSGFFRFPIIEEGHFGQLLLNMVDGVVVPYSFADIFDGPSSRLTSRSANQEEEQGRAEKLLGSVIEEGDRPEDQDEKGNKVENSSVSDLSRPPPFDRGADKEV